MTRQRTIEFSPVVKERLPLLREATRWVGHLPSRTRGTIGGSIAGADPSAEYPAVLTALDGEVVVREPQGERAAEEILERNGLTDAAIEAAARRASELVLPESDVHAFGDYRRHLTGVLTGRAVERVLGMTRG